MPDFALVDLRDLTIIEKRAFSEGADIPNLEHKSRRWVPVKIGARPEYDPLLTICTKKQEITASAVTYTWELRVRTKEEQQNFMNMVCPPSDPVFRCILELENRVRALEGLDAIGPESLQKKMFAMRMQRNDQILFSDGK